jgi:hypothetical protein
MFILNHVLGGKRVSQVKCFLADKLLPIFAHQKALNVEDPDTAAQMSG